MTRREGTSRSRIAIAVGVAGLALALFLRHLHGHRPTTSVEPPEARVAQPAAAPEASLASPTVASPAIEPDSAGSARTLAEPTRLVLTYRVLDFETDGAAI